MQALQAQPATSGELADQFGVSDRHIRRTIADLILEKKVTRQRDGRDFLYSLAAAVVEEKKTAASSTTTITGSAGTADNRGHNVRDRDLGHSSDTEGAISDIRGHDCGHEKHQGAKNRYRNRKRNPNEYGHPPKALRDGPEFGPHRDADQNELFPDGLAHFERDRVQFVLIDKKFRDILAKRTETETGWEIRRIKGLVWIVIPGEHLTLQIGNSTTTFYSDEPGDMSTIAAWARKEFTDYYDDIESLVARIKFPHGLSVEELCVVITDPAIISNIRVSIAKDAVNGVYNLPQPGGSRPGLKIYEPKSGGTMRVEFIATTHAEAVVALGMRENLMGNLPRMRKIPALFWEFVQNYYSALHHPIIIDTGGHEFLQALSQMSGQFTDIINKIADKIPKVARTPEEDNLRDLKIAIEDLESGELGDIIRVFRDLLNIEEAPTKVFLAAWTVWAKRNFKGRVIKADIASLLLRANDPLSAADIADAIVRLKQVRLLQEDEQLEICFSPEGAEMARILMAKREGM